MMTPSLAMLKHQALEVSKKMFDADMLECARMRLRALVWVTGF